MRHILLIHGAWQGAWAWDLLIPELESYNFKCYPVDMPGNGNGSDKTPPEQVSLDLYMDFLSRQLDEIANRVIVVGHSSGGIIASQLAENEPDRVSGLIYISGMMLPNGMAYSDIVEELLPEHPEVVGIIPYLNWSSDGETSTIAEGAAQKILFQDCPLGIANKAADKLKRHPQRGRAIRPSLTCPRFGLIPRAYIEANLDKSIVLVAQMRMQELVPGAARYGISTGHTPQLSDPRKLATIIHKAVQGFEQNNAEIN